MATTTEVESSPNANRRNKQKSSLENDIRGTTSEIHARQLELAKIDYQELRRSETGIHTRLQALLFGSATMYLTLAGLAVHNATKTDSNNLMAVSILFAPCILSCFMLGLYLQDYISIRKRAAFNITLCQFYAGNTMPGSYRGWEEANAFYTAIVKRHKLAPFNSAGDRAKLLIDDTHIWNQARLIFVNNMSLVIAFSMFIALPAACVITAVAKIYLDDPLGLNFQKKYPLLFIGVLATILLAWLLSLVWYSKRSKCLLMGRLTFNHIQALHRIIIERAPAYRPGTKETDDWIRQFPSKFWSKK